MALGGKGGLLGRSSLGNLKLGHPSALDVYSQVPLPVGGRLGTESPGNLALGVPTELRLTPIPADYIPPRFGARLGDYQLGNVVLGAMMRVPTGGEVLSGQLATPAGNFQLGRPAKSLVRITISAGLHPFPLTGRLGAVDSQGGRFQLGTPGPADATGGGPGLGIARPTVAGTAAYTAADANIDIGVVIGRPAVVVAVQEQFRSAGGVGLRIAVSAAAQEQFRASGGVTFGRPSVASATQEQFRLAGGAGIPRPSAGGTAEEQFRLAGGAVIGRPSVAIGTQERFAVTGGATIGRPTVAAVVQEQFRLGGGVGIPRPSVASVATNAPPISLAGGVSILGPIISGGRIFEEFELAGGVVIGRPSISAAALTTTTIHGGVTFGLSAAVQVQEQFRTSGGTVIGPPAVSAAAQEKFELAGGVAIPRLSINANVSQEFVLSGGVSIGGPAVSGATSEVQELAGDAGIGAPSVSGTASEIFEISGGVSIGPPVVSGYETQPTFGTARVIASVGRVRADGFYTVPRPPAPTYSGGGRVAPPGRPGVHITPEPGIKPKPKPAPKPLLPIRGSASVVAPPGRAEATGTVSSGRATVGAAAPAPLVRSHGRIVPPIKGTGTAGRRAPEGPTSHGARYPKTRGAVHVRTRVSGMSGRGVVVPPTHAVVGAQPFPGRPSARGRVLDPPRWEAEGLWLLGILDLEEAEDGLVPA